MQPASFRDKLSMIDDHGRRIPLFPAEVRGKWRTRRTAVQSVLILVFLALPWIRINGAPALLLDLPRREFAILGLRFWAHDGPLVFFLLALATLGLALLTALWGRVWCGWACPQTVFLDGVIRRIERWTEGTHLQRRALAAAPLSLGKVMRKTAKWVLFTAFAALLTHSFLAYFVGADRVLEMVRHDPRENWGPFVFILTVTGILLFDLAWFREQFCLIVCPYGRFQSVLMDRDSVTVQYDASRGEPRKGTAASGKDRGACVSCNRCVAVCPTGIDIRNGIQMECIACTACIDACDEIMRKVKQPEGLIRYSASKAAPARLARPRTLLYGILLAFMAGGLVFSVASRRPLELTLLRALDVPYFEKTGPDGGAWIVNSYRLHAHNQTSESLQLKVEWADPAAAGGAALQVPASVLLLKPNEFRMIPFLVEIPKSELGGRDAIPLRLRIQGQIHEVQFVGPRSP